MNVFELRKLIFSKRDKKLLKLLDENLNEKDHSKSIKNIHLIDELDTDEKRFLMAKLESIYESASIGTEISTYITLLFTLVVVIINLISDNEPTDEQQFALSLLILILFALILTTAFLLGRSISKKAKVKFYITLIKNKI